VCQKNRSLTHIGANRKRQEKCQENRPLDNYLLKKSIQLDKNNANAHYLLGIYYQYENEHDLAVNEYKILQEIDKDLAEQLFELIFKK